MYSTTVISYECYPLIDCKICAFQLQFQTFCRTFPKIYKKFALVRSMSYLEKGGFQKHFSVITRCRFHTTRKSYQVISERSVKCVEANRMKLLKDITALERKNALLVTTNKIRILCRLIALLLHNICEHGVAHKCVETN